MSASTPYPRMILSGGQTGVDRAALDVAIELGLEHGGWCPRGRKAEDGRIDDRYQLRETESSEYHVRTQMNVQAADATLILACGELVGGTKLTETFARRESKPYCIANLNELLDFDELLVDFGNVHINPTRKRGHSTFARRACEELRAWLARDKIAVLNIAGPRESTQPGVYQQACKVLRSWLASES